jgi:hypothetical protein
VIAIALLFCYVFIKSFRDKKLKHREFYLLFAYFYLGFWPLSFYLNGQVMGYHVLPFVPIALIILCSSYLLIRKEIVAIIFIIVLLFNLMSAKTAINQFLAETGNATNSWKFNLQVAKAVFKNAPSEFGYYAFTADEFGYGPQYAMVFANKAFPGKIAKLNTKEKITFAIMAPTENGANNNREWWIKNKVRISDNPQNTINYPNGFQVEKFILTQEETKIPADPNLINGLFFR